jgi:hypothetical protein
MYPCGEVLTAKFGSRRSRRQRKCHHHFEAAEGLLRKNFTPERTIYLSFDMMKKSLAALVPVALPIGSKKTIFAPNWF